MTIRPVADNPHGDTVLESGEQADPAPERHVLTLDAITRAGLKVTCNVRDDGRSINTGALYIGMNSVSFTTGGCDNAIKNQQYDTGWEYGEQTSRHFTGSGNSGATLHPRSGSSAADAGYKRSHNEALFCVVSPHPRRGNPVCSGQMYQSRFERGRVRQLVPHDTLEASRAFGVMRKAFFLDYLQGTLLGGDEQEIGVAANIFEGDASTIALVETSREALNTPVLLTDRMSDRVLAGYVTTSNPTIPRAILINTRFKVDPEVLAHALAEEVVHAQQDIDGVDFPGQKAAYAYADRPYEQDAKARATRIVGYEPDNYADYKRRDVPEGALFDGLPGIAECHLLQAYYALPHVL